MTRDFQIHGECLVRVKGGAHLSGNVSGTVYELGLTEDSIRITPMFHHTDLRVDDFGPDTPPEVLCQLAEARIHMELIHYDRDVLDICLSESLGGALNGPIFIPIFNPQQGPFDPVLLSRIPATAGMVTGAGTPLGGGWPLFASGNHLMSVNLSSFQERYPWRFRSCYLASPPVILPIGTHASKAVLNWRVIPYKEFMVSGNLGVSGQVTFGEFVYRIGEITSSGIPLWDHNVDFDPNKAM